MADDVVANPGVGGASFKALLDSGGTDFWPACVPSFVTGGSAGAWTLQPVDTTHGLPTSLGAGTAEVGNVKNSGTFAVQAAQSGAWSVGQTGAWTTGRTWTLNSANDSIAATQAGAWNVTTVSVVTAVAAVTSIGTIASALPAGANNIGQTQNVPGTAGGLSQSSFISAAGVNLTAVKGSAGQVYAFSIQQISATPVYLKVFNKVSTSVTIGTTSADYQFMCPSNATAANGAGVVFSFDPGIAHGTGIAVALTGGIGLADNTSIAASIAVVTVGYK